MEMRTRHAASGEYLTPELLSKLLAHFGIVAVGYVDDFIILPPPGPDAGQHAFVAQLFRLLGLTISSKPDGNVQGARGKADEILGLDYTSSHHKLEISYPENPAKLLSLKNATPSSAK